MSDNDKASITIFAPGYHFTGELSLALINKIVRLSAECIAEQHAENLKRAAIAALEKMANETP